MGRIKEVAYFGFCGRRDIQWTALLPCPSLRRVMVSGVGVEERDVVVWERREEEIADQTGGQVKTSHQQCGQNVREIQMKKHSH